MDLPIVDGHFGYCLFCLNLFEQSENGKQAIINSAKIEMISHLPSVQKSNLHLQHLKDTMFYVEIEDFGRFWIPRY